MSEAPASAPHAGSATTDPAALEALEALRAREPLFHRVEFGTTRADFERLIVADFWEVGASGRRYDRAFVLDTLEARHAEPHDDPWEVRDAACRSLGHQTFLFTYTLLQGPRLSRRATVWTRADGDWKAVYHQGTLVQNADVQNADVQSADVRIADAHVTNAKAVDVQTAHAQDADAPSV